jgi:hypothetical protein
MSGMACSRDTSAGPQKTIMVGMGQEFQHQAFRRRPGQGACGRSQRPGLEVAEIGGEDAQGVGAHALLDEVLERRDVVVGEEGGELVAALQRQDGGKRVERDPAAQLGIGGDSVGRDGGGEGHGAGSRVGVGGIAP